MRGSRLKGGLRTVDTGAMAHEQATNGDGSAPIAASDFRSTTRKGAGATPADGLHICPSCNSQLVYPTDWAPAEPKTWTVQLRCPDCEWHGGGVYAQDLVDRF